MISGDMRQEVTRSIEDQRRAERRARMQADLARFQQEEEAQERAVQAQTPQQQQPQVSRTVGPLEALSLMYGQFEEGADNLVPIRDDIVRGVPEIPGAALHGLINGANEVLGLIDAIGEIPADLTGIDPRITWIDPETGGFKLGFTNDPDGFRQQLIDNGIMDEAEAAEQGSLPRLPQLVEQPESVTGNVVAGIAQFMAGFGVAGKALKAAGWAAQPGRINWTRSFIQGAIADFAAFDGHEARLSDLVEMVPELQNPLTEYLASNEDDSELEGRLKNAVEGSVIGPFVDMFMLGARALHRGTTVKRGLEEMDTILAQADEAAAEAIERDIIRVGDPTAPTVSFVPQDGTMSMRLLDQALSDLESGNRGLSGVEQEHLLGAAERWAQLAARTQSGQSANLDELLENARSRIDNDDYSGLMDLMESARQPHSEAVSLVDWLRAQGGLQESAGELAGMGGLPMRLRKGQPVSTNAGMELINPNGLSLDRAAEMAAEAGYIGAREMEEALPGFSGGDVNHLLDALRREAGGDRVYSELDYDDVVADAARLDLLNEVERLGLDPNARVADRRSQAERLAAWEPGEPLTLRDMDNLDAEMDAAGARNGILAPGSELLGGQAVRINFNALNTPDDIRSIIGQLADAFSREVDNARGRRLDSDVILEGEQLKAWDALNARRTGEPLSDSQVLAVQSLYVASAENVQQAIRHAMSAGSDEAHFAVRRAVSMHRAVQAEIASAKADAARALRAWGIPTGANASSRQEMMEVLASNGGRFSDADLARLHRMSQNPADLDRAVRGSWRQRAAEAGAEALRFSFLSGPPTHIANMVGNSLTMMYDTLPRLMSGLKGRMLGDPELERLLGSALSEYAGLAAGVRAQFRAFAASADYGKMGRDLAEIGQNAPRRGLRRTMMDSASTLATENPVAATLRGRFDDRGVSGKKWTDDSQARPVSAERFGVASGGVQQALDAGDLSGAVKNAWGNVLDGAGRVLSAPTEFLGFQDDFFKGVNELGSRYRQAYDLAVSELGDGADEAMVRERMHHYIENPTREIVDTARREAQRRTFTEPVGDTTRSFMQMRKSLNFAGVPFGHIMLPFIVTPSNILKFAFQSSPVGFMFREIADELRAGGTRAEVAQARIAAGTGLLFLGMDLAANGQITGGAPVDPRERQLLERAGWQEYSVRIGDKYVSYRRLEPVSTMMAIGADLHEITSRLERDADSDDTWAHATMAALGAAIQTVTNKTYLTGVSQFVQFVEDPDRFGESYFLGIAGNAIVPTGLSQIERSIDPEIRDARSLLDRLKSRVPGLSDELPQQYDLWGRPRTYSSGMGRMYDALSPFTIRRIDPEPIDAELLRLNHFVSMPSKHMTLRTRSGQPVQVNIRQNPEIYQRFVQLAGNELEVFDGMGAKDFLNAIVSGEHRLSSVYNSLPDGQAERGNRGDFISDVIRDARQAAALEIQREFRHELEAMAEAQFEALRVSERAEVPEIIRP